jgi:hypothetical protein
MNFGEAMYLVLRGEVVYYTHGNFEDNGLPSLRIRLNEIEQMCVEIYWPEVTDGYSEYFNTGFYHPTKEDLSSSYSQVYHG